MHDLISPAVNFLCLVVLLYVFLKKPVKEMVALRRVTIQKQIDEAKHLQEEAERKYQEFSSKLRAFETESQQVLENAKKEAELVRAKIINEARRNAEKILVEAQSVIDANIAEFKDNIRKENIGKAVDLAESLIKEKLSNEDHRRMVHEYVGKV